MKKTPLTDEEIVAIFMGAEQHVYNLGFGDRFFYHFRATYPFDRRIIKDKEYVIVDAKGLYYRTDWEWLMEVVEKIESLGYHTTIQYRKSKGGNFHQLVVSLDHNVIAETLMNLEDIKKAESSDKKEAIFKGVVNFVKAYNKMLKRDKVIIFDSDSWRKTGDIGDNSQFYLPARILSEYESGEETLIDVQFDDGRISKGHFKKFTIPFKRKS